MIQPGDWTEKYELKSLPRLPIPPLNDTLNRFLQYIKPLVNKEEYEETKIEVERFLKEDGQLLHKKLLKLNEEVETSWIEGIWDSAYLTYRGPAPININPAFILNDDPNIKNSEPYSNIIRAARLLSASATFIRKLRSGEFLEENINSKTCLHQFTTMFGGAKIPRPLRDELIYDTMSSHVIVLVRNQYYVLDIFDDNGLPYSWKSLENILKIIWDDALVANPYDNPNVCVLTTENRDVWARIYPILYELNPSTLDTINSAALVLVLDDESPKDLNEAGISVLHNKGKNRWFDKSIQLIVHKNSIAGINMEHSGFDGLALIKYCKEIYDLSTKMKDDEESDKSFVYPPKFYKLQWNLNNRILTAMNRAERLFEEFASSMDSSVMQFKKIGKTQIKKLKISPDAIVQLSFHMAYYMTFHQFGSAYESCAMTAYYRGRTECLRSLTQEVKNAILLMCNSTSTAEDQKKAILKALTAHKKRAQECQRGEGVDRHLFALYELAKQRVHLHPGYSIPRLFSLSSWNKMRKDSMSTSNCGNQTLQLFTFGPVINDGLGIGYIIKDEEILVSVTSFQNKSNLYVANLYRATKYIKNLLLKGKVIRMTLSKL